MQRIDASVLDLKEQLVQMNRVAKVVKGGRTFRWSALVVVGDKNGHVGVGMGKSSEQPDAIRKAAMDAKKQLVQVPQRGTTIPHMSEGFYNRGHVLLLPAPEGTGVIAGGPVRAVLEMAGIKDIRTKSYGSNNKINCVRATIEGLRLLKTAEETARLRGKTVEELLG